MLEEACGPALTGPHACPDRDEENDKSFVKIDCNLTLKSGDRVTKRLIFEGTNASGMTLNCNKATFDGGKETVNYKKDMIEVRSTSSYEPGVVPNWPDRHIPTRIFNG